MYIRTPVPDLKIDGLVDDILTAQLRGETSGTFSVDEQTLVTWRTYDRPPSVVITMP